MAYWFSLLPSHIFSGSFRLSWLPWLSYPGLSALVAVMVPGLQIPRVVHRAAHRICSTMTTHVATFPGTGRGLAASQTIITNTVIIKIPLDKLINKLNIPASALLSVQAVSHFLVQQLHEESPHKEYIELLPEADSFKDMPLTWQVHGHDELVAQLPAQALELAKKVYGRFMLDYEEIKALDPELDIETYLWIWQCVNTRCLYMDLGLSREDNFTMAPYVDLLNHSDEDHCRLEIDTHFKVITTRKYNAGEQIFLSYGPHSNCFLLCEYGFVLPSNQWNDLNILDKIISRLSPTQIEFLKRENYFDEYTISVLGPSYRTEIALAALQEESPQPSRKLNLYMQGITTGESYREKSKDILREIFDEIKSEMSQKRKNITKQAISQLWDDVDSIISANGQW